MTEVILQLDKDLKLTEAFDDATQASFRADEVRQYLLARQSFGFSDEVVNPLLVKIAGVGVKSEPAKKDK